MVGLLTGCETTGLSLREKGGTSYSNYIMSLPSNTNTSSAAKLPKSLRLAVVQVGEAAPPDRMLQELRRHPESFAFVMGLPLPAENEPPYYYQREKVVPPDYTSHMKAIGLLARKAGADHVFLCGGSIDSWQQNSLLSVFDLTILGGFILPGTKISQEGKATGVLLEAETLQPTVFLNAESKAAWYSPDFLVDGKLANMRVEMRDKLMDELTAELIQHVSRPD